MFPFSEALPFIDANLDAEGSDHYGLQEDKLTAGTMAVLDIVNMAKRVEGANKFSEETLRDLTKVGIWECSTGYGRLHFNEAALGHEMMTIVSVMPDPDFLPGQVVVGTNFANQYTSRFRTDLSMWRCEHGAKRLTREQWNARLRRGNKFLPGNSVLATNADLVSYSYINQSDYTSSTYAVAGPEIEVDPIPPAKTAPSSGRYVAVEYLRTPARLTLVGSTVDLPDGLKPLFVAQTCLHMATKQGDGTNLYGIMKNAVAEEMKNIGW